MDEQGMMISRQPQRIDLQSHCSWYYQMANLQLGIPILWPILDEFWLKEINAERRKQDLGEVSSSVFEKIIDRLEKEWFDLVRIGCCSRHVGKDLLRLSISHPVFFGITKTDQKHPKVHREFATGGLCLQHL
jgi:hypothetical protein